MSFVAGECRGVCCWEYISRNKTAVEQVKLSIDIISNENAADPQLLARAAEPLNIPHLHRQYFPLQPAEMKK